MVTSAFQPSPATADLPRTVGELRASGHEERSVKAEIRENLELIDHKIDVYRGSLAAGDADRLWAPVNGAAPDDAAAHRR